MIMKISALTSASGVDLRFDNDSVRSRVEQLAGRVQCVFTAFHHLSTGHGHSILRKNGLSRAIGIFMLVLRRRERFSPAFPAPSAGVSAPYKDGVTVGNPRLYKTGRRLAKSRNR